MCRPFVAILLLQGKVKKTNWGIADAPAGEAVTVAPAVTAKADKVPSDQQQWHQSNITAVANGRLPNGKAHGPRQPSKDVGAVIDQRLMKVDSLTMTDSTDATIRVTV